MKTSPVWDYFRELGKDGKRFAECHLCSVRKGLFGSSTTSMWNHMKTDHIVIYDRLKGIHTKDNHKPCPTPSKSKAEVSRVFKFYRGTKDAKVFQCMYCDNSHGKGLIKASKGCTSNLWFHLRTIHNINPSKDTPPSLAMLTIKGNLISAMPSNPIDNDVSSMMQDSDAASVLALSVPSMEDHNVNMKVEVDDVSSLSMMDHNSGQSAQRTLATALPSLPQHNSIRSLHPRQVTRAKTEDSPERPIIQSLTKISPNRPLLVDLSIVMNKETKMPNNDVSIGENKEKKTPKIVLENNSRISMFRDRLEQSLEMADKLTRGSLEPYDKMMCAMNAVLTACVKEKGEKSATDRVKSLYNTVLECESLLNDSAKDAALVSFAKSFAVVMEKLTPI